MGQVVQDPDTPLSTALFCFRRTLPHLHGCAFFSGHNPWAEQILTAAKNTPLEGSQSPLPEWPGYWPRAHSYPDQISLLGEKDRTAWRPPGSSGIGGNRCASTQSPERWGSAGGDHRCLGTPPGLFVGGRKGEGRCALHSLGFGRRRDWRVFGSDNTRV